jgi:hypothetical protein
LPRSLIVSVAQSCSCAPLDCLPLRSGPVCIFERTFTQLFDSFAARSFANVAFATGSRAPARVVAPRLTHRVCPSCGAPGPVEPCQPAVVGAIATLEGHARALRTDTAAVCRPASVQRRHIHDYCGGAERRNQASQRRHPFAATDQACSDEPAVRHVAGTGRANKGLCCQCACGNCCGRCG